MGWPEISPSLALRPFQRTFIDAAIAKAASSDPVLVADVCPGSGKTIGFLAAAAVLRLRGVIDQVIVYAPRHNLAEQVEHSWRQLGPFIAGGTLGPIEHRENVLPMLRNKAWGYSSTYQAAIANPDLHYYSVRQGRTLLVLDEGQQLGVTAPGGEGTYSAKIMARLSAEATLTCLLSGTPYRADGQPLLLAKYGPEDGTGHRPLLADVRATYVDGVAEGYLRECEFHLHNGRVNWLEGEGEGTELELSRLERRIGRVIRASGYWQPLVDRGVRQILALQRDVDPRLCGLIAAADQEHARQIVAYVTGRYRALRVLLATQDERAAQENLRRFRGGGGDLLVSVAMCHMGYDYPPISVIVPLTTARADGWLRQLMARGQRMMPDLDRDLQTCYGIVPDDPGMARFALGARRDSVAGLLAREERESPPGAGRGKGETEARASHPDPVGIAVGATLTTIRAIGYDPRGDADPTEVLELGRLRDVHQISAAVPLTKLAALVRAMQTGAGAADDPPSPPPTAFGTGRQSGDETAHERERALRILVSAAARACDTFMIGRDPSWERGDTHRAAGTQFGKAVAACDEAELQQRLAFVRAFHRSAVDGDLAARPQTPEPPAAD